MKAPLLIPVHFDFASTICYVAHRAMQRLRPALDELEIELDWRPIDLSRITGTPRGIEVPEARRAHARQVGAELGIEVEAPRIWWDSRLAGAAALVARREAREESWRERVFSACFEEGRGAPSPDELPALARDLAWGLDPAALEDARETLETDTLVALEAQVTGVPTFMLGGWPVGGIQCDETMLHMLGRYARKVRGDSA